MIRIIHTDMQSTVPWTEIEKSSETLGTLSAYYSNKKANLPIRDVQKPWDQKSDPNIETMTYGLFSTCMPPGRRNIVTRGDSYLFFLTNWKEGRIITGYYQLGWYVNTGITARNSKRPWKFPDYALKAKKVHFVKEGIKMVKGTNATFSKLSDLVSTDKTLNGYGPRNFVRLNEELTLSIRDALDEQEDSTLEYIKEMKRLEHENKAKTGYSYPIWKLKDGFSDKLIPEFINWQQLKKSQNQ